MALSDLKQSHLYKDYEVVNSYSIEPGVLVLPVAEAEPTDPTELAAWSPVVVVQAFAPVRHRNVQWKADKKRRPPLLPAPADTGSSVFVGGGLTFSAPAFNLSSSDWNWTVEGAYSFVDSARHDYTDGFVIGGTPFPLQTQMDAAGAVPPAELPVGAASEAGTDARIGVTQGAAIDLSNPLWEYQCPSYFPGVLFSASILNGEVSYSLG